MAVREGHSLNICPHCGSDVLDSSASQCSSCGSDLHEPVAKGRDGDDDADRAEIKRRLDSTGKRLDDTSPIDPSADLEVVSSGQAFWANSAEAQPPEEKSEEEFKEEVKEEFKEESEEETERQVPEDIRTTLLQANSSAAHAPSLADLARQRREQMETEDPDSGAQDSEAKDPESRFETDHDRRDAGKHGRRSTDRDPDDTAPGGIAESKPAAVESPVPSAVTVVSKSPDVAFIDGNHLYVPNATWSSGENVVIQGRTYQLKRKISRYPIPPKLAGIGTACVLVGILFGLMFSSGGDTPTAHIFGVVREMGTGNVLPGVTVALEDGDQMAESDPSGMFYFQELEEGIYTLIATDPIYGKGRMQVTVSGEPAAIVLDMQRPPEPVAPVKPPRSVSSTPKKKTKTTTTRTPGTATTRGKLAVTANVQNAKVYIEKQVLGVGNAVYSGIRPGNRTIKSIAEGFKPWVEQVTIKAGRTTHIEPILTSTKPAAPVRRTPEQYAADGRKFMKARQYKAAVEQFNLALNGAESAQFYAWRADAHVGLKQLAQAERDFMSAVALFQREGKRSRLDDVLSRAVLVVPASSDLRMAYGDYLYQHRKLRDAEKNYRRAVDMGGDPVRAYTGVGLAQYAGGSFDEAVISWERADAGSGEIDSHLAGYLALVHARLQHRASCRSYVRRMADAPDVIERFRAHPDWDRVQRLTGEG